MPEPVNGPGFILRIDLTIPHNEHNFYVLLPKNPRKWATAMKESAEREDGVSMNVCTLPHGCGGVGIAFSPCFESDVVSSENFAFVVDHDTLAEMIRVLQLALDHYKP